jgi:hypothetical protein
MIKGFAEMQSLFLLLRRTLGSQGEGNERFYCTPT